jgi:hypothetical protein
VNRNGGQIWCHDGQVFVGNQPGDESADLRIGRDIISYSFGTRIGPEAVDVRSVAYIDKNAAQDEHVVLTGSGYGDLQDASMNSREKSTRPAAFHIVQEDGAYKEAKNFGESVLRSYASGRFVMSGVLKEPVSLGTSIKISNYDKDRGDNHIDEKALVKSLYATSPPGDEDIFWRIEAANPDALLEPGDLPDHQLFTSTALVRESSDAMNRAKVCFPWDRQQNITPWLRLATPSWGEEHFHYIPPREDDTVLVMWGQWDMDPVIIGSVAAGHEVGEPTDKLAFQTVEGHKVSIDGERILITNEAGGSGATEVEIAPDKVVVTTSDGHTAEIGSGTIALKHGGGGTIEIDSSAISIASAGDLELKSGQGASIKLSGPQVSINNGALEVI